MLHYHPILDSNRSAVIIAIVLLVGGTPKYSPVCVAVVFRNAISRLSSAIMCSMVVWESGNLSKKGPKNCLKPPLLFPTCGLCCIRSCVYYLSTALILCSLKTSSINDLTSVLLSSFIESDCGECCCFDVVIFMSCCCARQKRWRQLEFSEENCC